MPAGWGGESDIIDQAIERHNREEEERQAAAALAQQRAAERQSEQNYWRPQQQQTPQWAVPDAPAPQQVGLAGNQVNTGVPQVEASNPYATTVPIEEEHIDRHRTYTVDSPEAPRYMLPGDEQRTTSLPLAGSQQQEVQRSSFIPNVNLPETGNYYVDQTLQALGMQNPPQKEEDNKPEWMKWVEDNFTKPLVQDIQSYVSPQGVAQHQVNMQANIAGVKDWWQNNPNILTANSNWEKELAARNDPNSYESKQAQGWVNVGKMLADSHIVGIDTVGQIIQWANSPEANRFKTNLGQGMNMVVRTGTIPATTPVNQWLLNKNEAGGLDWFPESQGRAIYDQPPSTSVAEPWVALGSTLMKSFNPLNPNFNWDMWSDPEKNAANTARIAAGLFPKGQPYGFHANLTPVDTSTTWGKILAGAEWVGLNAVQEFTNLQGSMQQITEMARVKPEVAAAKSAVWSGNANMTSAATTIFNKQAMLDDMAKQYTLLAGQGDADGAALMYKQYMDLKDKSVGDIINDNTNIWADLISSAYMDVSPLGWGGHILGHAVGEFTKIFNLEKAKSVYVISKEAANANLDLALVRSGDFVKDIAGTSTGSGIMDAWAKSVAPYMSTAEKVTQGAFTGPVSGPVSKVASLGGLFGLDANAKALIDADTIYKNIEWIFKKTISTKEDARMVLGALVKDPKSLITGLTGLTSEAVTQFGPEGFMKWGPGEIGNSPLARRFPLLTMAHDMLQSMSSIQGEGLLEGEKFYAELGGVLYDTARTLNGVRQEGLLPFGATAVKLIEGAQGLGRYAYQNAKGKNLFLSDVMPLEDARKFVEGIGGSGAEQFMKGVGKLVNIPLDLQKRLMSDMWLFYSPANMLRNSVSGSAMLMVGDMYGQARKADMIDWFVNKLGVVDPLTGVGDMTSRSQTGPGLIAPILKRVLGDNWAGNLITGLAEKVPHLAYGDSYVPGTNIPIGEEAMRMQGFFRRSVDNVTSLWTSKMGELYQGFTDLGVDPKVSKPFLEGLKWIGINGSREEVLAYRNAFAETGKFMLTPESFNLPTDILSRKGYSEVSRIFSSYGPEQWPQAQRELKAMFSAELAQPLEWLRSTPKQTGDFNWMKVDIRNQAEMISDLSRRYMLRAGEDITSAGTKAAQTADQFLAAHADQWNNFREALRAAPNTPNSWAVVGDYYNDYTRITRSANAQVDQLTRDARSLQNWGGHVLDVQGIYAQLGKDVTALGRKYTSVLEQVKAGKSYTPVTSGWLQALEDQHNFDNEWFQSLKNYKVKGVNDPKYTAKVSAYRKFVETKVAGMMEAFRMFPSMDNFDIVAQTSNELSIISRSAAEKMAEAKKALEEGRLSVPDFRNISDMTWEQAWGYMGGHAEATGRAITAHALTTNTSDTLKFKVADKEYFLYGPKNGQGLWDAVNVKDGSVKTFAGPAAAGTPAGPNKLPVLPQGIVDEYYRLVQGRAAAIPTMQDANVAAGAAAVPSVAHYPEPRVIVPPQATRASVQATVDEGKAAIAQGDAAVADLTGASPRGPAVVPAAAAPTAPVAAVAPAARAPEIIPAGVVGTDNMSTLGSGMADAIVGNMRKPWIDSVAKTGKLPAIEYNNGKPTLIAQVYERMVKDGSPRSVDTLDEAVAMLKRGGSESKGVSAEYQAWRQGRTPAAGMDAGSTIPEAPGQIPGGYGSTPYEGSPSGPGPLPEQPWDADWQGIDTATPKRFPPPGEAPEMIPPVDTPPAGPSPAEVVRNRAQERVQNPAPSDAWTPPSLGRKDFWGRAAESQVYVAGGEPYLRMTAKGAAKLIPEGTDHLWANGGMWQRAGEDAYYIVPIDSNGPDFNLTPGGMRKKSTDILGDVQSLLTGTPHDATGIEHTSADYQWWRQTGNQPVNATLAYPAMPDEGQPIKIGSNDQLGKVFEQLGIKPDTPTGATTFDSLNERYQLPRSQDRRIFQHKLDPNTYEFKYLSPVEGQKDLKLYAQKKGEVYIVTFPDGKAAAPQPFKTLEEAATEAHSLMKEGVGTSAEGVIVKRTERRFPAGFKQGDVTERRYAKEYLKGMSPSEMLNETFANPSEPKSRQTVRVLLRMSGVPDEMVQSWVANGNRGAMIDAIEHSLGMRGMPGSPIDREPFFFGSVLPIPPEVLAMFQDGYQTGVQRLAREMMGGIAFSQKTKPLRGVSVSDLALHSLSGLQEMEHTLTDPVTLQRILGGMDSGLDNNARQGIMALLGDIGGMHDDVHAAAFASAEDDVNWALLDFRKSRKIDHALHMYGPFSFFQTRMPGRSAMAALQRPDLVGRYYKMTEAIKHENEKSQVPDSLRGTVPIPGSRQVMGMLGMPPGEARVGMQKLVLEGYPGAMWYSANSYLGDRDPDNTGDALMSAFDAMNVGMGPMQKTIADSLLHGSAMDPTQKNVFGPVKEPMSLGSMVPAWQMWYYHQMAQSGKIEQTPQQGVFFNMQQGNQYDQGRIERNINANQGLGTDTEAYARAQVAYDASGQPAPEGSIPLAAQNLARTETQATGAERFWHAISAWSFSPITVYSDKERDSRQQVDERRSLYYDQGANPAGSRRAVREYDESNNNEAKDFMSYVDAYDVPQDPKKALAQAQANDLGYRLDAIDNKYAALKQQWIDENPTATRQEYNDYLYDTLIPHQDAAKAKVKAELPLGASYADAGGYADIKPEDRFAAENPEELQSSAKDEAIRQAEQDMQAKGLVKPIRPDNPTFEDSRIYAQQKEGWDNQVNAAAQTYLNDPQWVQTRLGGRNPQTGKIETGDASTAQQAPSSAGNAGYSMGSGPEPGNSDGQGNPLNPGSAKDKASTYPAGLGRPHFGPWFPATVGTGQESAMYTPDPNNPYADKMAEQEKLYGLPPGMVQAIISHETGGSFDPASKNESSGAMGMGQFMPNTWKGVAAALNLDDPYDADQAIEATAYYLNQLNEGLSEDKKNDPGWMAAAYNDGPGAVADMTSLEDILNLPYKDKEARLAYARRIQQEVSAGSGTGQATAAGLASVSRQVSQPGGALHLSYPVPDTTRVSQDFGANVASYKKWNGNHGHEGIDFAVPVGTPVGAAADGTVEFAGSGAGFGNYGNYIVVDHGNGVRTYYGHLSAFDVAAGDTVTAGQQIGESGNTGRSSGAHLHFGVRVDGDTSGPYGMVDPTPYLDGSIPLTQPDQMPVGNQQMASGPSYEAVPGGQQAQRSGNFQPNSPIVSEQQAQRSAQQPTQMAQTAQTPVIQKAQTSLAQTAQTSLAQTAQTPMVQSPQITTPDGLPPVVPVAGTAPGQGDSGVGDLAAYRQSKQDSYQTPAEQAQTARFDANDQASLDYVTKLYPQYANEFEEYQAIILQDKRSAYSAIHPEVKAVNLAYHNPAEVQEVESMFGAGATLRYARIPPSELGGGKPSGEAGSRDSYYRADPTAMLTKSWIEGRPTTDDDVDYERTIVPKNWGADYQEAQKRFGKGIWDTVVDYYRLPGGQSKEARTARAKWHEANPSYSAWSDWWYAGLGNNKVQSASFGGFGYYGHGSGSGVASVGHPPSIEMIRANAVQLARARRGGVDQGGWRKWLNMGK